MVNFLTNGGNMKKIILLVVAIVILSATCLVSCFGSKDPEKTSNSTPAISSPSSEAPTYTIELSHSEITLSVGQTFKLEAEVSKPNAYVFWSVQDNSIAKVSDDGTVTALAVGQTICYAKFGKEEAMCLIKVAPEQATPMLSVSVAHKNNELYIYVGDSVDVNATAKLGDQVLTDATITYVVSNTDIVRVTGGTMTALSAGKTTILVKVTYQGQEATVELTVNVITY